MMTSFGAQMLSSISYYTQQGPPNVERYHKQLCKKKWKGKRTRGKKEKEKKGKWNRKKKRKDEKRKEINKQHLVTEFEQKLVI